MKPLTEIVLSPPTGGLWPFSTFAAVHQFGSDRRRTGLCADIVNSTILTHKRHSAVARC
jgi:hypothetical protein